MTEYHLEFRPYRRPFLQPLRTAHGSWTEREGIILQLRDGDGRRGFGEVAPLPEFGTEETAAAARFLASLDGRVGDAEIEEDPPGLPCCAFALSAAREMLLLEAWDRGGGATRLETAALLPAGEAGLWALRTRAAEGFRCFKWKIAVMPGADERAIFARMADELPPGGRIRLDANGGLDRAGTERWLDFLSDRPGAEFLEQPLRPEELAAMIELAEGSPVAIALDESVAARRHLAAVTDAGWAGPVVVKPALMGTRAGLRKARAKFSGPVVYSSVFETLVAADAILRQAADDVVVTGGGGAPACGFGTAAHFPPGDGFGVHGAGPWIDPAAATLDHCDELWEHLTRISPAG